jgi:site-specific recombinase XerC
MSHESEPIGGHAVPRRAVIIQFPSRPTSPAPAAFATALDAFLGEQEVAGRAEWTRRKHQQELERYERWLVEQALDWQQATEDDLLAYVATRAHLGHSARRSTIVSLRVFYAWATKRRRIDASPATELDLPGRPAPAPRALKKAQVRELVAYLASQEGLRARRDEAVLLTGIYAGLRAAELAVRDWEDVDLEAATITIRLSKGNHGRVIPIHGDLLPILRRWHEIQGAGGVGRLFTSTWDGTKISAARIGKIANQASDATGIDFTAHTLRHTFATWLLKNSKDLYAVSKALGHKQVKQTEIYVAAAADVEYIAEAMETLPNRDEW